MLVRDVVGEFELVEGDDLLHPLLAGGRAVRVDVHALRHLRVRLASHYPTAKKRKNQQRINEDGPSVVGADRFRKLNRLFFHSWWSSLFAPLTSH